MREISSCKFQKYACLLRGYQILNAVVPGLPAFSGPTSYTYDSKGQLVQEVSERLGCFPDDHSTVILVTTHLSYLASKDILLRQW